MTDVLIKTFGERNTGTNYLIKLIAMNLEANQLPGVLGPRFRKLKKILPEELVLDAFFFVTFRWNLGWKHAVAPDPVRLRDFAARMPGLRFVTITKNPYSWLLSLHKRPYHHDASRKQDFETFLQSRWNTVNRERAPDSLSSPIDLWNLKNASYVALKDSDIPAVNIRFEDLLSSPERLVRQVASEFQCPMKRPEFQNLNQSAKGHEKDSEFYKDYYLNEKWRPAISSRSIRIINEGLSADLMKHFKYDFLE